MRIVYQRCCGMDVHKDRVTVCLLIIEDDGEFRTEKRQFGTMTRHLEEMASWLEKQEVICCSMVF
jgi:transposase